MNKQEIFDRVWAHASQMTEPARTDTGACRYRMEDGNRCFIGDLISDECYFTGLEGKGPGSEQVMAALKFSGNLLDEDVTEWFLKELQSVHDSRPMSAWEPELLVVARNNNLTAPATTLFPNGVVPGTVNFVMVPDTAVQA